MLQATQCEVRVRWLHSFIPVRDTRVKLCANAAHERVLIGSKQVRQDHGGPQLAGPTAHLRQGDQADIACVHGFPRSLTSRERVLGLIVAIATGQMFLASLLERAKLTLQRQEFGEVEHLRNFGLGQRSDHLLQRFTHGHDGLLTNYSRVQSTPPTRASRIVYRKSSGSVALSVSRPTTRTRPRCVGRRLAARQLDVDDAGHLRHLAVPAADGILDEQKARQLGVVAQAAA